MVGAMGKVCKVSEGIRSEIVIEGLMLFLLSKKLCGHGCVALVNTYIGTVFNAARYGCIS